MNTQTNKNQIKRPTEKPITKPASSAISQQTQKTEYDSDCLFF